MMVPHTLLLPLLALGAQTPSTAPSTAPPKAPRLVVQITVDQLRGDFLPRFRERFGTHGFRWLMEHGVDYRDARFAHATTYTAVGHATLFTGAHPEGHGIVGNFWLDRRTGEEVYCVDDPLAGKSARQLLSSTTGDELVLADPRSRAFSASFKDRGAILPAGKHGKAFWYDKPTGAFVTSPAFYPRNPPAWAVAWNEAAPAERFAGAEWGLLRSPFTYRALERDDRPAERPPAALDTTFPHVLPDAGEELFRTLPFTPFGDELLLEFVRELVVQEELGKGPATDFLAVSFSCSDSIGHTFGPLSLEAEDNLLRLDETLARFFLFLDERVGLDRCLVVLSSDHGIDLIPEARHALTCADKHEEEGWGARSSREGDPFLAQVDTGLLCCSAGRHYPAEWLATINRKLAKRWNLPEGTEPVLGFWNPSIYLDEDWFAKQTLERSVVERIVAAELREVPGIALVLERHRLLENRVPRSGWVEMVQRGFHPSRSGDWIVVQEPFWFLNPVPDKYAAMHGSPYAYDTHVPLLFAGAGIRPAVVHRRVGPHDVAPTIAAFLGIPAPSASVGEVLAEVLPAAAEARSFTAPVEAGWRR